MRDANDPSGSLALIEAIAAAMREELGVQIEDRPGFEDPDEAGQVNRAFRVSIRTVLRVSDPADQDRSAMVGDVLRRLARRRLEAGLLERDLDDFRARVRDVLCRRPPGRARRPGPAEGARRGAARPAGITGPTDLERPSRRERPRRRSDGRAVPPAGAGDREPGLGDPLDRRPAARGPGRAAARPPRQSAGADRTAMTASRRLVSSSIKAYLLSSNSTSMTSSG